MVLTDEDKHRISEQLEAVETRLLTQFHEERRRTSEQPEGLETKLLGVSQVGVSLRSARAAVRPHFVPSMLSSRIFATAFTSSKEESNNSQRAAAVLMAER